MTHDHAARQHDDPNSQDYCKDCGQDIVWVGPGFNDWIHADEQN